MKFAWPEMLWLLALAPLLVALYAYLVSRKRKLAMRYASFAMLKDAMGASSRFRRHIPPILFLLAIVSMIFAIARPSAVVTLPAQHETVVLAIDVSGSMRATDVEPNRLVAAQAAARTFVEEQPRSTRVAVVAFAATALVVQHPTQNREEILAAIDRLQLQRGTAIGSGIVVSLATIFPGTGITLDSVGNDITGKRGPLQAQSLDETPKAGKATVKPVPAGSFGSAAIILLTDGQRTTGPDPLEAARLAAERGIRIFTVGIGTPDGEIMGFEGWRMRVRLDEATLKNVSTITHGQYFYAGNAAELKKVYRSLNSRFVLEKKETEVSALFAALAALLAIASAMLSLLWFNRIL